MQQVGETVSAGEAATSANNLLTPRPRVTPALWLVNVSLVLASDWLMKPHLGHGHFANMRTLTTHITSVSLIVAS